MANVLCDLKLFIDLALTSKDGVNFRKGVAIDRLVGFQDLGGKDDFTTKTLEALLLRKGKFSYSLCCVFLKEIYKWYCSTGILSEVKRDEEDEDGDYHGNRRRAVRSSAEVNSDSDWRGKGDSSTWIFAAFHFVFLPCFCNGRPITAQARRVLVDYSIPTTRVTWPLGRNSPAVRPPFYHS